MMLKRNCFHMCVYILLNRLYLRYKTRRGAVESFGWPGGGRVGGNENQNV